MANNSYDTVMQSETTMKIPRVSHYLNSMSREKDFLSSAKGYKISRTNIK